MGSAPLAIRIRVEGKREIDLLARLHRGEREVVSGEWLFNHGTHGIHGRFFGRLGPRGRD